MIARTMRADDRLLLQDSMAKEAAVLEAAYDDSRGITAAFNLNLLRRINHELGAASRSMRSGTRPSIGPIAAASRCTWFALASRR